MDIKDIHSWLSADERNASSPATSEAVAPGSANRSSARGDELGDALDIKQVAALIGCSVWSVRHVLLNKGLPCLRIGANGKLIFYEKQVVRWVLRSQRAQGGQP